jgi:hypothetical protein
MYKLIKSPTTGEINAVTIVGQNICIPFDPDNQDFVQYQKWLSEGNQPLPADEPNA